MTGVRLEDGLARAESARARRAGGTTWELELTLREGRNREVRRLCEALGLTVERLVRTAYGPVTLDALQPSKWRELQPDEVRRLLNP
jgi:23S rRNA pseudouridine2605 synthase